MKQNNMKLIIEPLEPYKVQIAYLERKLQIKEGVIEYLKYRLYEYQNEESRQVLNLKKENTKLKASLRKVYEKYIKPYEKGYEPVFMPKEVAKEVNDYLAQFYEHPVQLHTSGEVMKFNKPLTPDDMIVPTKAHKSFG